MRIPMGIRFPLVALAVTFVVTAIASAASQNSVLVSGVVKCDGCTEKHVAYQGALVAIECRNSKGEVHKRGVASIDGNGAFKANIPLVESTEECHARLLSRYSKSPCSSPYTNGDGDLSSRLVLKNNDVGDKGGTTTFGISTQLRLSAISCPEAFSMLFAPFPKVLPLFSDFPPKSKFFPPLPKFPPKPKPSFPPKPKKKPLPPLPKFPPKPKPSFPPTLKIKPLLYKIKPLPPLPKFPPKPKLSFPPTLPPFPKFPPKPKLSFPPTLPPFPKFPPKPKLSFPPTLPPFPKFPPKPKLSFPPTLPPFPKFPPKPKPSFPPTLPPFPKFPPKANKVP